MTAETPRQPRYRPSIASAMPALPIARRADARAAAMLLLLGPVAFAAAGAGQLSPHILDWLQTWGTSWLFLLATILLSLRVVVSERERGAWAAFALGSACWTAANLYYAIAIHPAPSPALSWSDVGYLAFPVCFAVGLFRFAQVRLPRVPLGAWFDALIVALGSAAVVAALVFSSVAIDVHRFSSIVTTILYPAEDIIVVGLMVGVGSVLGWRLGRAGRLLAAAIGLITAADVVALTQVLGDSAYGGAWPNLGWSGGIALLTVGAWVGIDNGPRRRPTPGPGAMRVPIIAGFVSMGVLVLSGPLDLGPAAFALGGAAVAAVLLRMTHALREVRRLAESHQLAVTDELTGLSNRRRLLRDLKLVCEGDTPRVLTLFDLDGFKQFNDVHGHVAGDELLASIGAVLAGSLPPRSRAYRLGGDEFCTLVREEEGGVASVTESVAALTAGGDGWSITPSWGSVRIPEEADSAIAALRIADRRMYEQKRRRPGSARAQVRDALLGALGEQQPALRTHTQDVTEQVQLLATRLGMSDHEVDDAVQAAELHDIGKLAMPASILDKPGPLDDAEMQLMRTHTIVGERMLLAAPALRSVAPLVRASHERWDGGGYPDGLAGTAIPLGARIIAVCDSFDAMIAERPYRPPRSRQEAIAELCRCSGTQFDPAVVEVFVELFGG